MTEPTPTSADLQIQARQATIAATQIAQRRTDIDLEIRAKREEIKDARLAAARAGSAVETPTLNAELEALLGEREDLPEQHFAAREDAAVLGIQAEAARQSELAPQIRSASDEFELRNAEAQEAKRIADEAWARLSQLKQAKYVSRTRESENKELFESIEKAGVWHMPTLADPG